MNWLQQRWENRTVYRYHFLQSTYISSVWAWFLTFWGKAAEPFLCVSVLYSGAKLLPGVSTNPTVDTVMFIGQMLALDIGGLSLGKIAQQLAREGNAEQAGFIKKVSFFLISLMIANVVLATVQHLFPALDQRWITGVESVLLIVRSVMAVIYGYIIYNLHPGSKQETSVVKSSDVKSQYEELVNLLTALEQKLTALERKLTDQSRELHQETREEFTKQLQAQTVNIHRNMREELTAALHQHNVNIHHQVTSLLHEQSASIGTQVMLAFNEQSVTLTESVNQLLHDHLANVTTRLAEELTAREPVTKKLTRKETGELTSLPIHTQRPSNITVLTVNTSEKKRLVEECILSHPGVKNADIQRLVKEQGVDVTAAYISMIRNGKRA